MPIPNNDEDSQITGIPADVAAILDEASVEGGKYSAKFTAKSVQLVDSITQEVAKEVFWHRAGEYANALQKAVIAAMGQK